ncbi:MAG TPA: lysophospholipid acyltransferase family protein [Thermogutta sp.]|nr:lysophospholipid acyltransferase family protein [Thermogutta sp.]HQF13313.1 lysophospholipid acyltransferase family protein [Thermogutta sp.]
MSEVKAVSIKPRDKDLSGPPFVNVWWYEFSRVWVRLVARVFFRIRYSGVENIPRTGPVLLVSNHQSHLDPPLIGAGVPRTVSYLARKTLFTNKFFSRLITSYGAIPLDLENPLSGLKEALRRLRCGDAVLIFPEGTRSPDGEIHPFRKGFRVLAVRSQAIIVPLAIEGAYQSWPRSRKFPRPGRIRVHFGRAIGPQDYENLDEEAFIRMVEEKVRQCLATIRSESGNVRRNDGANVSP